MKHVEFENLDKEDCDRLVAIETILSLRAKTNLDKAKTLAIIVKTHLLYDDNKSNIESNITYDLITIKMDKLDKLVD